MCGLKNDYVSYSWQNATVLKLTRMYATISLSLSVINVLDEYLNEIERDLKRNTFFFLLRM